MRIVGLNGSLRRNSSNAALLRAAMRVAPSGVQIVLYDGTAALPHFNPDLDAEGSEPPPAVASLRTLLIESDGILISSPEYAHGVPGAFKNLLDWLVSTGELVDKPVALLNASPSGGTYAQSSLAETLRTMNWNLLEEACLLDPFVRQRIVNELEDEQALLVLQRAIEALVRAIAH